MNRLCLSPDCLAGLRRRRELGVVRWMEPVEESDIRTRREALEGR